MAAINNSRFMKKEYGLDGIYKYLFPFHDILFFA